MQIFSFKFLVLSCLKLFILISITVGENSVFLSEIQVKTTKTQSSVHANMPLFNITISQTTVLIRCAVNQTYDNMF